MCERERETEDVPRVLPEQLQGPDSLTAMVNAVKEICLDGP